MMDVARIEMLRIRSRCFFYLLANGCVDSNYMNASKNCVVSAPYIYIE